MLDVVAIGEAMVRLAPPPGEALESAPHFDAHVAGSEANVAVTLARMGFRAGWVSKLVTDPLGRRIAGELRRHGVDTSAVIWTPVGRTGLYFVEHAPPPRGVTVYYDRAASAWSTVTPEEVDWEYVHTGRWLHLSGITPALSDSSARTVGRAISEAKRAGRQVAFDLNHRRKLWNAERARTVLEPMFGDVDLLIATHEDVRDVLGLDGDAPGVAARLKERYPKAVVVVTAGAAGGYLADGRGVQHEPGIPGTEVDPVGRGDAFAAGLLWGMLEGDVRVGLRYGAALASLAQTYWGDVAWSVKEDVLAVIAGRGPKPLR